MVNYSRIYTVRIHSELEPCGAIVAVKKLGCELRSALPIFNIAQGSISKTT